MGSTESLEDERTVRGPSIPATGDGRGPQVSGAPGDNALPIGTALGEFEIVGLIGEGGFGIVYLAYDHSLQRKVALKEYMPAGLASRKSGMTVAKSRQHVETFQAGLRSFINEARLLAQFDHPSLVKVHRFWEANGTAYMVMPFYEGSTLGNTLRQAGNPPGELWLKQLLKHLLNALEIIHAENCFHRDISPDNILILKDGRPLLLDFGAARRVISNMSQNLTVILKPGYAPIEQYAEMESMKQGAWTDIYALAAVIYFAITRKTPPPAVSRIISDSREPLSELELELEHGQDRYSPAFLHAIDKALAVKPEARPQNIPEFEALLDLAAAIPPSPLIEAAPSGAKVAIERETTVASARGSPDFVKPRAGSPLALYGSGAVALLALIAGAWFFTREEPGPAPELTTTPRETIIAKPAPPADYTPLNKTREEVGSVPAGLPEPSVSAKPEPVTAGMSPDVSLGIAPEAQQHAAAKPAKDVGEAADKSIALPSESSSKPPAAAPLAGKHEPRLNAIEKIVTTHLVDGRACLDDKNFECAIAKSETVLQLEPGNATAGALLKDARTGQQEAWEASELK